MNGVHPATGSGRTEPLEALRRSVYELTPGAVPLIRELVRAELIAGWRNVVYVGPHRELAGVTAEVYLRNSTADKEVRERNGTLANADQ